MICPDDNRIAAVIEARAERRPAIPDTSDTCRDCHEQRAIYRRLCADCAIRAARGRTRA